MTFSYESGLLFPWVSDLVSLWSEAYPVDLLSSPPCPASFCSPGQLAGEVEGAGQDGCLVEDGGTGTKAGSPVDHLNWCLGGEKKKKTTNFKCQPHIPCIHTHFLPHFLIHIQATALSPPTSHMSQGDKMKSINNYC